MFPEDICDFLMHQSVARSLRAVEERVGQVRLWVFCSQTMSWMSDRDDEDFDPDEFDEEDPETWIEKDPNVEFFPVLVSLIREGLFFPEVLEASDCEIRFRSDLSDEQCDAYCRRAVEYYQPKIRRTAVPENGAVD